ncbi:SHOCT domain-containing protein, partial [Halorubrum ezzemoulense]
AEDRDTSPADADREAPATPIERLKHRYVEGDISDAEFERRLDRLVSADRDRTDSASRRETPETTAPEHER